MEPYVKAGGKFLGALREKGIPKEDVSPEWGPPLRIFDNRIPERPVRPAEYDVHHGWDMDQDALRALSADLSVDDLKKELR
eukprot:1825901-Karenia_brevis.AAC.1